MFEYIQIKVSWIINLGTETPNFNFKLESIPEVKLILIKTFKQACF